MAVACSVDLPVSVTLGKGVRADPCPGRTGADRSGRTHEYTLTRRNKLQSCRDLVDSGMDDRGDPVFLQETADVLLEWLVFFHIYKRISVQDRIIETAARLTGNCQIIPKLFIYRKTGRNAQIEPFFPERDRFENLREVRAGTDEKIKIPLLRKSSQRVL